MAYTLSLTQSQSLAALRTVLMSALPSGLEIVQGEDNQIPEPISQDFVIFWPILRERLETNTNTTQDCVFTGSVTATTLTVMDMLIGAINVSAQPTLFGASVLSGTQITQQITGVSGSSGTYTISKSQIVAHTQFAAGFAGMMQPTQLTVQCDIHGPNSADNVQIISTLMRSSYACDLFAATGYDVTPLYASDPRQSPFQNAESQIERMWSCDISLQVNPIVYAPQQYFDAASVTVMPPIDLQ